MRFLLLIFIVLLSCDDNVNSDQKNRLIGTWQIQSIINEDGISSDNMIDFIIIFQSNGIFIREEESKTFTGKWDLRSNNSIKIDWDEGGTGIFRIDKINDKELIYSSTPDAGTGLSQLLITYSFIKLNSSG